MIIENGKAVLEKRQGIDMAVEHIRSVVRKRWKRQKRKGIKG